MLPKETQIATTQSALTHLSSDLLLSALLSKCLSRDSQHPLKTLAALSRVLAESVRCSLLNAVLNLLPATAKRNDLSCLVEVCLARGARRGVSDSLLHREQLAPGQVLRAHGDRLFAGVDVGDFIDEAAVGRAEKGLEPGGHGLLAGDEALGAELQRFMLAKRDRYCQDTCPDGLDSQCRSLCQVTGSRHPLR